MRSAILTGRREWWMGRRWKGEIGDDGDMVVWVWVCKIMRRRAVLWRT
jgi:hypothetical protein